MVETVQVKFRLRRDTAGNWTAADPVLALGEPGLETNTRLVKYGDGLTKWSGLAYANAYGAVKLITARNVNGVAFDGTADINIKINNADWNGADLEIANGGTGASSAAAARTNLGAAKSGSNNDITGLDAPGSFPIRVDGTVKFLATPDGLFLLGGNLFNDGQKVVGPRIGGWAVPTGTATRSTFATSTVTVQQLAERLKALIDDMRAHGLIGA